MTPEDANRVLQVIVAAWPRPEWTVDTLALWQVDLERFDDPELVMEAVDVLRWEKTHRPSMAEISEQVRALRREKELRDAETRALPEADPANEDAVKRVLAHVRTIMNTRPRHDHSSGAKGCPTCSKRLWEE